MNRAITILEDNVLLQCPNSTDTALEKRQIELLSHFCLDGSYAHLSTETWKATCLPYYKDEYGFDKVAGVIGVLTFAIGVLGNLLTLLAIPLARFKHKYDFHRTFWNTDIWILHLA